MVGLQAARGTAPAPPLLLERLAGYTTAAATGQTAVTSDGPPPRPFDVRAAVQQQIQRLVSIQVWEGDAGLHLMDLTFAPAVGLQGPHHWEQRLLRLEWLIRHHEPRLQGVSVSLAPPQAGEDRLAGHFIVEGRLVAGQADAAGSDSVRLRVASTGLSAVRLPRADPTP